MNSHVRSYATFIAAAVLPLSALTMAAPAAAADNGKIVYSSFYGGGKVMIVDPVGGATPQPIGPELTGRPSFAPDGTRVAAITTNGEVQTFAPDGSALTTVANGAAVDHVTPAWSPDASQLAYWVGGGGSPYSLVINSSFPGGTPQTVTAMPQSFWPAASISWSPNGSTLLFSGLSAIYSVPATPGATPATVPLAGSGNDYGPSWSPDGSRFAFVRECLGPPCAASDAGLWTAKPDGSDATQLVSMPAGAGINTAPSWSPDGTKIAFAQAELPTNSIRVANSTGGGQAGTPIVSAVDVGSPSWGPPLQTPKSITAPTITGTPAVGQTLMVAPGVWSGMPTAFGYSWQRCTPATPSSCTAIPGAASSTYMVTGDDVGRALLARVSGTNAAGQGSADSSMTGVVPALPVPKALKAKATSKAVKASWKSVNGASKYKVKVTGKSVKNRKLVKKVGTTKTSVKIKAAYKPGSKVKVCVTANVAGTLSAPACKKAKVSG